MFLRILFAILIRVHRLSAMIKKACLSAKEKKKQNADPKDLKNFEKRIYSQNGEDGILEEIFSRIGIQDMFFVEFGIEPDQNNTLYLLAEKGWRGIWMDGNPERTAQAAAAFKDKPVKIQQAFITRENITDLFSRFEVPKKFDLLSIDIDGNDYWVAEKLLREGYRPRVLLMEYNASHIPPKKWIMPYNPENQWLLDDWFGASLESLKALMEQYDYALTGCDSRGVNAFFVKKSELKDAFPSSQKSARYHYVCPKYNDLFFGHPPSYFQKIRNMYYKITGHRPTKP